MAQLPDGLRLVFEDDFDKPVLNLATWLPHYLPAWSRARGQRGKVRDTELLSAAKHPAGARLMVRR